MPARGAARALAQDHDHDALTATPDGRGRWVVRCRCGHGAIGATLDSASRAHRQHANYLAQLAADASY